MHKYLLMVCFQFPGLDEIDTYWCICLRYQSLCIQGFQRKYETQVTGMESPWNTDCSLAEYVGCPDEEKLIVINHIMRTVLYWNAETSEYVNTLKRRYRSHQIVINTIRRRPDNQWLFPLSHTFSVLIYIYINNPALLLVDVWWTAHLGSNRPRTDSGSQ